MERRELDGFRIVMIMSSARCVLCFLSAGCDLTCLDWIRYNLYNMKFYNNGFRERLSLDGITFNCNFVGYLCSFGSDRYRGAKFNISVLAGCKSGN